MKANTRLLLALALLFAPQALKSQPLPQAQNLLPEAALASSLMEGPCQAKLSLKGDAAEIEVLQPCDWAWDSQLVLSCTAAVKAGDSLLLSLWARAKRPPPGGGEALFQLCFEGSKDPWAKSVETAFSAPAGNWRRIDLPFKAAGAYAAGGSRLTVRLGFSPQILEIKGLSLLDYGAAVPLTSLPRTEISYRGREPEAAWRREAFKRIAALRTAKISVRALNTQGKPLQGAKVRIRQVKSAFRFGTAISAKQLFLSKPGQDRDRYASEARRLFNIVTEENSLKWKSLAGDSGKDFGLAMGLKSADWAAQGGMDFRGHCLLWPSWHNSPKLAEELKGDPAALRKAILDHVRSTVAALKGKAADWDVVNEPWDNHEIMDILGDGILAECYQAAHEADPGARLFINDYAILENGAGETTHRQRYEAVIRGLLKAGAPLDGIGIQGHFGQPLTPPEDCLKLLDRFAAFGKPLLMTEYDVEGGEPEISGDYLRDLLIALYSHPAVEGFMIWGFWDGKHWHKNAALYNKDWSPKPALKAYEELVLKAWKTDATASTGKNGRAEFSGHLGDYEISLQRNGGIEFRHAKLTKDGLSVDFK